VLSAKCHKSRRAGQESDYFGESFGQSLSRFDVIDEVVTGWEALRGDKVRDRAERALAQTRLVTSTMSNHELAANKRGHTTAGGIDARDVLCGRLDDTTVKQAVEA
jgi:hypothetical protein